ncbi:XTP/dITP diphosphohydrolase [Stackebrandtia albiflava]|uniref:XTP/dITP diphosphohydrolase n=1 Tax=Stackebrandtia albiflava TaxID=406432 RepID=A0A562UR91_9ACTN|nr:MazG family protein [Stackebrandtia albiflava]TWJ08124.1 XTP/dITP diphosphohydrolase [Stackebrandtia albiflava]
MPHIHWLITSPRLPAGLLSAAAWDVLCSGTAVFAAAESPLAVLLRDDDVEVTVVPPESAADRLLSSGGVWLAGPDGDETLAAAIGRRLPDSPGVEFELLYGSWDPPGARLLDLVAVIDRLRSPGGCPWDAAQTHRSLAPYLLEEAYETADAIASGDPAHLREELGDLLFQPLLHARLASEDTESGFDADDVAADVVAKLIRRHPHVFGDVTASDLDELGQRWDAIKAEEKPERRYAVDGVVSAQPALSLAAKFLSRVERAGLDVPVPAWPSAPVDGAADEVGDALLAAVAAARAAGVDAESALREAALRYADTARATEDRTS